jgi:hypothetical protein
MYALGAQKTISLTELLDGFSSYRVRGSVYFLVVSSWTKFGCKEDVKDLLQILYFQAG